MKNILILSIITALLFLAGNPKSGMLKFIGVFAEELKSDIKFNLANVPHELLDLVPLAKKWGIGDDAIRGKFQQKASDTEKEELKNTLEGRTEQINKWLDTFSQDNPMPEEAGYFLYMLEGLDEMELYPG